MVLNHQSFLPPKFSTVSPVVLWFNLKQIATQTILKVSSREKCALQHTKSPKEFLGGKCKTFLLIGDYIIREFKLYQGSHFSVKTSQAKYYTS